MSDLFNNAKKATPAKKAAKKETTSIMVNDPDFFEKVEKLEVLQDVLKSTKTKADLISDELKDIAKREWCNLYEDTLENPETIVVRQNSETGDIASIMLVPSDKYITINEDRATELKETYGNDIVEEKTTFTFDNEMIEKYGEVLSKLIQNCLDIEEEDKDKLIKATTSYSVSKGTINKFKDYGDVNEMMETVKPVVSIKNVEIIKG